MEYNSFLQKCKDDDVLEIDSQMVKLSKFSSDANLAFSWSSNKNALLGIVNYFKSINFSNTNIRQLINDDGIEASILCIGSQGWKKGKIKLKVTLEFCPDQSEVEEIAESNSTANNQEVSPLDDIRQRLNK